MWFETLVIFIIFLVLLTLYNKWQLKAVYSNVDLTGKTALVTGSNQGIGYWAAMDLATRNARVILLCRSFDRGAKAVKAIKQETGNDKVLLKVADLSDFRSVKKVAAEIINEESRLDILINNAGIPSKFRKEKSNEGNELVWSTNHFGPFLLTNLLLDLLKRSAPSRIVNVSSSAHWMLSKIDLNNLNSDLYYRGPRTYADTKLANILVTRELSHQLHGTGVTANSLEPGSVSSNFYSHMSPPIKWILQIIAALFFISSEEGSRTTVYCAVSEELDGVSGRYFSNCQLAKESYKAKDDGLAKKLWEASEKFVGLSE